MSKGKEQEKKGSEGVEKFRFFFFFSSFPSLSTSTTSLLHFILSLSLLLQTFC
jgi:hypothetical protein